MSWLRPSASMLALALIEASQVENMGATQQRRSTRMLQRMQRMLIMYHVFNIQASVLMRVQS